MSDTTDTAQFSMGQENPDPTVTGVLSPAQIEVVVSAITEAWEAEKAAWWQRKSECAATPETCECTYKDCYEHGKWHSCPHGEPDWGPRVVEAVVRRVVN